MAIYVIDGALAGWRARKSPALVLITAGAGIYAAAAVLRLAGREVRLVAVDPLLPATNRGLPLQRWLLSRVDRWGCIRRGDIATLGTRFGVDADRCAFLPFPPSELPATVDDADDGYVYAAGSAHRDWATLFRALDRDDIPAIVSLPASEAPADSSSNVTIMAPVSPEQGRALAARAAVVVVPLNDTHLPAGPTTLVDAQALGRPVVATDANGTRDYIENGVTGFLVPPGDSGALAEVIERLLSNDGVRRSIGLAARDSTRASIEQYATGVAALYTKDTDSGKH